MRSYRPRPDELKFLKTRPPAKSYKHSNKILIKVLSKILYECEEDCYKSYTQILITISIRKLQELQEEHIRKNTASKRNFIVN